jgi:peptide/nickel transport system ATP-binding protein
MLTVEHLSVRIPQDSQEVLAVDDISFSIGENKTVGLVGESGSGKSITALSLIKLTPPTAILGGKIMWENRNVLDMNTSQLRALRGHEIGLIFQNPLASLNPVFTVGNQMIETICLHQKVSKKEAKDLAIDLLKKVRIPDPEKRMNNYPHEFSLGMCQRAMIALTLSMRPKLLIADEPTASLDVTVQAQILDLLEELQESFKMSILLISHDMGVISQNCDEVLVMYVGKIVERGTPDQIFNAPQHPYTQALIEAIPKIGKSRQAFTLQGDPPSPLNLPKGCRFQSRCPKVIERCRIESPPLVTSPAGQACACWVVNP